MEEREALGLGYVAGSWPLDPAKPTLVFVHGAGGSSTQWVNQLQGLADVANTVALDLPGHGRSPGPGREKVEDYARLVVDWIDAFSPPRPVPVGFSMGGAIVQQVLLDRPDRFMAAVLIATGAKLRVLSAILETIEKDFPGYIKLKGEMAASPKTDPERIRPVLEDTARCDPTIVLGDFRACDAFDVRARVGEIRPPVLVVTAEDDLLTPPKFGAYLAGRIPHAHRVHIVDAGHLVSVEKPNEVNRAIREFLHEVVS